MKTVLFLGAGVMGAPMASNLAAAGYDVTLWNRSKDRPGYRRAIEKGCRESLDLPDEARKADIVLSCLKDGAAVRHILLDEAVCKSCAPGTVVVDMSTVGPACARDVGACLSASGLSFLDAPVSGGEEGAVAGSLTIMAGGDPGDFARALPVFQAMGRAVHHCGPVGAGQSVKLVNQLLCAVHMRALCEALALAEHLGLDSRQVVDICASGAAGSWALQNLGPKAVVGDFAPGFSIGLIRKDIGLVMEAAKGIEDRLEGLALASASFDEAARKGDPFAMATQAMILNFLDRTA